MEFGGTQNYPRGSPNKQGPDTVPFALAAEGSILPDDFPLGDFLADIATFNHASRFTCNKKVNYLEIKLSSLIDVLFKRMARAVGNSLPIDKFNSNTSSTQKDYYRFRGIKVVAVPLANLSMFSNGEIPRASLVILDERVEKSSLDDKIVTKTEWDPTDMNAAWVNMPFSVHYDDSKHITVAILVEGISCLKNTSFMRGLSSFTVERTNAPVKFQPVGAFSAAIADIADTASPKDAVLIEKGMEALQLKARKGSIKAREILANKQINSVKIPQKVIQFASGSSSMLSPGSHQPGCQCMQCHGYTAQAQSTRPQGLKGVNIYTAADLAEAIDCTNDPPMERVQKVKPYPLDCCQECGFDLILNFCFSCRTYKQEPECPTVGCTTQLSDGVCGSCTVMTAQAQAFTFDDESRFLEGDFCDAILYEVVKSHPDFPTKEDLGDPEDIISSETFKLKDVLEYDIYKSVTHGQTIICSCGFDSSCPIHELLGICCPNDSLVRSVEKCSILIANAWYQHGNGIDENVEFHSYTGRVAEFSEVQNFVAQMFPISSKGLVEALDTKYALGTTVLKSNECLHEWTKAAVDLQTTLHYSMATLQPIRQMNEKLSSGMDSVTNFFSTLFTNLKDNSVVSLLLADHSTDWTSVLKSIGIVLSVIAAASLTSRKLCLSSLKSKLLVVISAFWAPFLAKLGLSALTIVSQMWDNCLQPLACYFAQLGGSTIEVDQDSPIQVSEGGITARAQGMSIEDIFKPLSYGIMSIVSLILFNTMPAVNDKHGMIGKLSALGKNMSALNGGLRTLDDWASRVVTVLQSWIVNQETSESPIVSSIKLATNFDVLAWIDEVSQMSMQSNRMHNFGSVERTTRVRHLYDMGMKIQEFCITHAIPYALSTKVSATHKMALDLLNEAHSKKGYGEMRVDPFHVCLYGGPGIGKSTALGILPEDVCNYFEEPIVERRYARSTASNYWDNYCGQTYVCFDDLQSVAHTSTPTDITELISLKSNAPYQLPMAAVEEKGRFFTSKYIYSTTNLMGLLAGSKINVSDAFLRRRNLMVLVERGKDANGVALPMYPGTLDHLRFSFLDPMSGEGTRFQQFTDDNGDLFHMKDMTYQQFRIEVFIKMEKYFEIQDSILASSKIGSEVAGRSCHGALAMKSDLLRHTAVAQSGDAVDYNAMVLNCIKNIIGSANCNEEVFVYLVRHADLLIFKQRKEVVLHNPRAQELFNELSTAQCAELDEYVCRFMTEVEGDKSLTLFRGIFPKSIWSAAEVMMRSSTLEGNDVSFTDSVHTDMFGILDAHLASTMIFGCKMFHARETSVSHAIIVKEGAVNLFSNLGSQWDALSPTIQMALKVTLAITAGVTLVGAVTYGIKTLRSKFFPQRNIITQTEMESMLTVETQLSQTDQVKRDVLDIWANRKNIIIDPQAASDIFAIKAIHGPISHAMGHVMRSIDTETTDFAAVLICTFIGGTNILVPGHTFTIFPEDSLFFVGDGKRSYRLRFSSKNIVRLGGYNKDAVIYKCGNSIPSFPSLISYFVPERDLKDFISSEGALVGTYYHNGKSVVTNTVVPEITKFSAGKGSRIAYMVDAQKKKLHTMQHGLQYSVQTMGGDCGSLLVGYYSKFSGRILGFHVAADLASTYGCAEIITQEDLEYALHTMELRGECIVHGVSAVAQALDLRPESESRLKRRPVGDIVSCGSLAPGKGISPPEKTQIIPSPLFNKVRPHTTEPAVLSPNDPRLLQEFSPIVDGLSKFGTSRIPFKQGDLDKIEDYLTSMFQYRESGRKKRSVLSDEQAINGIPDEEYYDCVNMSSAEGWPLVKERPPGERNKRWLFSIAGAYHNQAPIYIMDNPHLKELYAHRESEAKCGRRVESYSIECPKDERRALKKIYKEPATRLFAILPVDYNLLIRKYFLDFSAMVMTNRRDLPPSVGINPESMEWSELYHKLKKFSDVGFAGDYKLFDGQADPQIFHLICNVINKWYDDGVENARVRHVLLNEVSHRQTIAMDLVLQIDQGMPSGFPLTVILNCLLNMAYLRLAWLNVAPEDKIELHHFDEGVMDKVYGDDNILAIKPSILTFYNLTTVSSFLAEHGIILTDNFKQSGALATPCIPVSEFTFLKRGFKPYEQCPLLMLSPLDKDSIEERVMWLHSGGDDEEVLLENCQTSLKDAAHWGKKYFDDLSHRVNIGLIDTQRAPITTTYAQIISDWYYNVTGARKTSYTSFASLLRAPKNL